MNLQKITTIALVLLVVCTSFLAADAGKCKAGKGGAMCSEDFIEARVADETITEAEAAVLKEAQAIMKEKIAPAMKEKMGDKACSKKGAKKGCNSCCSKK